jgi:hypothetical protein
MIRSQHSGWLRSPTATSTSANESASSSSSLSSVWRSNGSNGARNRSVWQMDEPKTRDEERRMAIAMYLVLHVFVGHHHCH